MKNNDSDSLWSINRIVSKCEEVQANLNFVNNLINLRISDKWSQENSVQFIDPTTITTVNSDLNSGTWQKVNNTIKENEDNWDDAIAEEFTDQFEKEQFADRILNTSVESEEQKYELQNNHNLPEAIDQELQGNIASTEVKFADFEDENKENEDFCSIDHQNNLNFNKNTWPSYMENSLEEKSHNSFYMNIFRSEIKELNNCEDKENSDANTSQLTSIDRVENICSEVRDSIKNMKQNTSIQSTSNENNLQSFESIKNRRWELKQDSIVNYNEDKYRSRDYKDNLKNLHSRTESNL